MLYPPYNKYLLRPRNQPFRGLVFIEFHIVSFKFAFNIDRINGGARP